MRSCPNDACLHRARTGERAVFAGERTTCSDCDAELVLCDDDALADASPPTVPSERGRRALVSFGVVGALLVARFLPSIAVSAEDFLEPDSFDYVRQTSSVQTAYMAVTASFALVELVAIVVPALRRRRHDHPRTRRTLTLVASTLAVVWAVIAFHSTAAVLVAHGMSESVVSSYVVSSLLGFAGLAAALAVQRRWGFGGAWPLLILAVAGEAFAEDLTVHTLALGVAPAVVIAQGMYFAAWAGLAWGFLSGRVVRGSSERAAVTELVSGSTAYREIVRAPAERRVHLRVPLWGHTILLGAVCVGWEIAFTKAAHFPGIERLGAAWDGDPWLRAGVQALVGLGWIALLTRLPTSLRDAKARLATLPGGREVTFDAEFTRARAATRTMILVACALELLAAVGRLPIYDAVAGTSVMLFTALVMDLVAEWRAFGRHGELVPLVRDGRVWLADAMAATLTEHGVPAFVRSANYRQLVWWAAPQMVVVVMVPRERAEEARALVTDWQGEAAVAADGSAGVEHLSAPT